MNLGTRVLVMGLTDSGKSRFISEMCEYFSRSSKDSTPPVKPGLNPGRRTSRLCGVII
ncbi:hypothetical protein BDV33DRAFT_174926 [Aspergillus novoparasiticus]|uniref:Uncharacterized protein n=1 Tax=Aspergillus novoparasiticus TaxID=986946 RepID=A0A5N6EMU1_9EURO|nr:hypothetical protein BDV33DRAFT_174926 [Aspergillus novoparasiticus]